MRRSRTRSSIVLVALSSMVLALMSAPARADTVGPEGFDGFALGSPNGQHGWSRTGAYDHEIADPSGIVPSFGDRALRVSNAVTSGSFGDHTFSQPNDDEAGEATADNSGQSGGVRQPYYEATWDFASAVPGAEQPGLNVVASPDKGDGGRMSWVQMADTPTGLEVNFFEYVDSAPLGTVANPANGRGPEDEFVLTTVAENLSRTVPHSVSLTMELRNGKHNDVVTVCVDGTECYTGTSWEDYFRWTQGPGDPEQTSTQHVSRTIDSMLFRTGGTAAPATSGNGFFIDELRTTTSPVPSDETIVVNENDGNGWFFYDDTNDSTATATGNFVTGPGTPPAGTGSAHLATPTAPDGQAIFTLAHVGTRLDAIGELGYSTYRASADAGNNLAIALQFGMDYDKTDTTTAFQGRLVWEPYLGGAGGAVIEDTWQTWDPLTAPGGWWMTSANPRVGDVIVPRVCAQGVATDCTWAQVKAAYPDAALAANPLGVVGFKAGSGWAGFNGNVDAFNLRVDGGATLYDFEHTLDVVGPITSDTDAVPQPVNEPGDLTLTANVDDSTTGGNTIASAEYNVDGGAYSPMDAADGTFDEVSEDVTATVSGLAAGPHTLCVRGTDSDGATGADDCVSITVDPKPTLSFTGDRSRTEPNTGTVNMTFSVLPSAASTEPMDVHWATAPGTATAPADFVAESGDLHWAPGSATARTFTVAIKGDLIDEFNETYTVNLSAPVNATIGDGTAVGRIVDNDPPPTISIRDAGVDEGDAGTTIMSFQVRMNRFSGKTVTVQYTTADGSAVAPGDYTTKSGTVTFMPGVRFRNVNISIKGDVVVEPNESLSINLFGATNATIGDPVGTGVIRNDD